MVSLAELWAPIALSGVGVFVLSFFAWMVLPHHRKDWVALPDEGAFFSALKDLGMKPGEYMFPWCHGVEKAEMMERYAAGPWGTFYLLDKKPNFGRNLGVTFLFDVVVALLAGYVASISLQAGADGLRVFRVVSVCAFMGHCLGSFPHDVFTGRRIGPMGATFADGFVYSLITGGIFAWLWPDAAAAVTV